MATAKRSRRLHSRSSAIRAHLEGVFGGQNPVIDRL
jgi:hypothetical protein